MNYLINSFYQWAQPLRFTFTEFERDKDDYYHLSNWQSLIESSFAGRIDENMDDTLVNVEGAQNQLARYLNSISSNRWLIIKIFFVLVVFLMIFLFFVA